jgi:hypothetical protein
MLTPPLYFFQIGIIVSIQVQLLTSNPMASSVIPRIFLTLGLTSELLGVMLVISFIRFPVNTRRESSNILRAIIRATSEAPTILFLMGVICVAAALVVDMLDVSIGTAVAMGCVLIGGGILCLLACCFGSRERFAMWD